MENQRQTDRETEWMQGTHSRKTAKVWQAPEVVELPKLTDLTLQSGSPIPGIGNPGDGSTVF